MPRPRSFRFHLLRLVLAGLIPTSLFAALLMVLLWNQQQAELYRSLQDTARAMSLAADREVDTSLARLDVLSKDQSFIEGHWEDFHRHSRRLVETSEDWVNLLVYTADGEELLNVRTAYGDPLPQFDDIGYVQEVVETGRPVITDLFVSPATDEQVIHVAIPVYRETDVALVMAASLNRSGFDRLLRDQAFRGEGIAAIFDRDMRYIGRSRDALFYLGAAPTTEFLESARRQGSGAGRFPIVDSPDVYQAWTRSDLTGWTVSVGVPAAPVEASLRRSLLMLTSTGLTVLLMTVVIASHLGRRLTHTVAQATRSAQALATGVPLPQPQSSVSELDALGGALERTGVVLKKESEQRAAAERERQLLLEREQLAREQAEAAGRAKDEFLAMLGHELRNPLAPILFAVELAKGRPNPSMRELEVIERQAKHIVQLVDDLLDVARIVQGKISLNKKVGELRPIIDKAMEIAAPLLETKQHVLTLDVADEGLLVDADETRMAQVVANLLTNAAKFTPRNGHVWLTACREDDTVVIRVRDNGRGISTELLPTIFDSFTQGGRSHDEPQGGLGLGLALVRSFVQLHGGTVRIHSEGPNRGSEFTVCLPAATAVEGPSESQAMRAAVARDAHPGARILVVDDNIDAADTLAQLLIMHGHEVRTAYDGRRALEAARAFDPQVAVIDIGMPVMDGYEVAQELSRWRDRPYLIAVTGYGQAHDRERSAAAGFDQHLVKPIAADQLLAYLEQALREHASMLTDCPDEHLDEHPDEQQ